MITKPAIRIKITGACNRCCSFCHEEGGMDSIVNITPDAEFFDCVGQLANSLNIIRVMLTGGEPTIHLQLNEIIKGINLPEISLTSNGIKLFAKEQWKSFKDNGLTKVILSIHSISIQSFLSTENRRRPFGWAIKALQNQYDNLVNICEAGIPARVNVVTNFQSDETLQVILKLRKMQTKHKFEIRILDDLTHVKESKDVLDLICSQLEATEFDFYKRAVSSSLTRYFKTPEMFQFSIKISNPYYFDPICGNCSIRKSCYEGFYGIRLERRCDDYYVRLCLYKDTAETLMTWKDFLASELLLKIKNEAEKEIPH